MNIKNIAAAILSLLVLMYIPCSSAEITPSQSFINQASDKFMQKDLSGALNCLNEAIKISPNNPQLYLNRGFLEQVIHDYNSALTDYNKALELNPRFYYAYNNRGVLKASLNDFEGAINDYNKALSLNEKYADVYYNRANLKYMLDDLNGALEDYDKAIELNPKDSDAYNNRGVVKKRMNFNVGALSDYSQAIALNPKDSIAYTNRGHLKKLYFDNEGAAIDLNQAIALAENQTFIKNVKPLLTNNKYIANIPVVSAYAYDFTDTNDNLSKTTKKIALNTQPAIDISNKINNKPNKKTETVTPIQAVTKEQKQDLKNPVISAGVGKVAIAESPDIRTTAVTKKATTNIKLAESYYISGLQKCIFKDLQGAISDLNKALENNLNYAEAYYYRAAIRKELGDTEGFRTDYSKAIQINPSLQAYNDSDALSLINN